MTRLDKASYRTIAYRAIFRRVVATFLLALPCLALAFPIIDISGWWMDPDGGMFEIRQQQASLALHDAWGTLMAEGTISNDTAFVFLEGDTLVLVYSNNTLSGNDPQGNLINLVRSLSGPDWKSVGCHTITVDGLTNDWSDAYLVAADPNGDATGNSSTEIDKFYMCHDQTYLYVRIDFVGPAVPMHTGQTNDRYTVRLQDSQHLFIMEFWSDYELRLRTGESGGFVLLDPPGVAGHTVEGRVRLATIGNMQRTEARVLSEYYHSEQDKGSYDDTGLLAQMTFCLCGDFDGSENVNISDILYFLNWVFTSGPAPLDGSSGDINCDQRTNVADAVYLVRYIFAGGSDPCSSCR